MKNILYKTAGQIGTIKHQLCCNRLEAFLEWYLEFLSPLLGIYTEGIAREYKVKFMYTCTCYSQMYTVVAESK